MLPASPEFDRLDSSNGIQYGLIQGNTTLLYIKVGAGGTIQGYNNKYIAMAIDANHRYGCSVLVASNPDGILEKHSLDYDMAFIHNLFDQCKTQVLGMGVSKGGLMFLQHAWRYNDIKKALLINAPLTVNTGRILKGIETQIAILHVYMVHLIRHFRILACSKHMKTSI